MKTVRIRREDALRIARVSGFELVEGENMLSTGAKLYKRQTGRVHKYYISGYHYAGNDVDMILNDFGIATIW